jgi:SNF2 family DNA or RNA helicase
MSFVNAVQTSSGQIASRLQSAISKALWGPHDYQIRGIKLLISQAVAGLFLDPGLGKTAIVLAAFKILKARGFVKKILIIAPVRTCYKVWPDEVKKWADFEGFSYAILHGKDKEKRLQQDVDIYIINPEGLQWLFQASRKRPEFDILCIDESSKFKNSQTQRFKLLKPLLPSFSRRWILTGTPAPNGLTDLFGQIYILDLGRALGRYITHYRNEFFDAVGFGGYDYRPKQGAFERIVERINPLVLQLSAEEYLKMPELISTDIRVDLPKEAMETYRKVEDAFFLEMESGNIVAANAAVAGGKCRQIANGAVYITKSNPDGVIPQGTDWADVHNAKLDALEDLVDELGGKPLLVLYEFRHDAARILERFPTAAIIDSKTSPKKLAETIDAFNQGRITMLLGHPASMGHGLNLQGACHHAVWFGITWNLEYYDQAIARIYRQGQKSSTVFIYHIVASNTLDERVLQRLTSKDRNQQSLLSALGGKSFSPA